MRGPDSTHKPHRERCTEGSCAYMGEIAGWQDGCVGSCEVGRLRHAGCRPKCRFVERLAQDWHRPGTGQRRTERADCGVLGRRVTHSRPVCPRRQRSSWRACPSSRVVPRCHDLSQWHTCKTAMLFMASKWRNMGIAGAVYGVVTSVAHSRERADDEELQRHSARYDDDGAMRSSRTLRWVRISAVLQGRLDSNFGTKLFQSQLQQPQ